VPKTLCVTMDARREVVDIKTQVAVRKESFTVGLVRLSENTFFGNPA
jgi:hypothetical protein